MPIEVKEAFETIRNYDIAKGKAEGKAEGELLATIRLFRKGLISEEVALSNLGLSKEEFDQKVKELNI